MKKIVFAAGGVLLVAVLLGSAYFLMKKNRILQPDEVLQEYYSYIDKGDYDKMYNHLTEQSRSKISEAEFTERNQNIYEGIEAEKIRVDIQENESNEKEVFYSVTMDTLAGKIQFAGSAVFEKEEKHYRLKWGDHLIFPNLEASDKIRVTTLQAKRGEIYDRSGGLLAGVGLVSSVGVVPGKMSEDSAEDLERLAQLLEIPVESIESKLEAAWVKEDSFVPVKKLKKQNQAIDELLGEAGPDELQEQLLAVPGVMITDVEERVYPLGEKASHLTGYVQAVSAEELEELKDEGYHAQSVIGKSGMESLYEEQLRGQSGSKIAIVDEEGKEKQVLVLRPQEDGTDITTTIDAAVQQTVYDQFSGDKSCSVVMNPVSGEVLALVNTPSFDSNDFILGMSADKWNSLNEDENQPLVNRFRQRWAPGSVLKPAVAGIGLTQGAFSGGEDFGKSGLSWQRDDSWGAYEVTTLHEYEGGAVLANALIHSDNIYFAKAALKIGEKSLVKGFEQIGFGQEMPFEITMKESQYANEGSISSEVQLADSGYGQGEVLVNPLHLASIYSAFVNGGDMVKPYLEYHDGIASGDWIREAFSAEAAGEVKDGLIQVVNDPAGTGYKARMENVVLAGKTGTAEIKASKEDTGGTELGWFAVFTADDKAERPVLLISMVEDVKDRGGSGYVVEKDKAVLDSILAQ